VEQEAISGRAGGTAWQLRRLSTVLGTRLGRRSCEVWTPTLVHRGFSKECIDYD
jgi:hypothetical protein